MMEIFLAVMFSVVVFIITMLLLFVLIALVDNALDGLIFDRIKKRLGGE